MLLLARSTPARLVPGALKQDHGEGVKIHLAEADRRRMLMRCPMQAPSRRRCGSQRLQEPSNGRFLGKASILHVELRISHKAASLQHPPRRKLFRDPNGLNMLKNVHVVRGTQCRPQISSFHGDPKRLPLIWETPCQLTSEPTNFQVCNLPHESSSPSWNLVPLALGDLGCGLMGLGLRVSFVVL